MKTTIIILFVAILANAYGIKAYLGFPCINSYVHCRMSIVGSCEKCSYFCTKGDREFNEESFIEMANFCLLPIYLLACASVEFVES